MTTVCVAFAAGAAGLVPLVGLGAQSSKPAFEVASIRRNDSGTGMMTIGMQPGGRINFVNVPVQTLIVRAYGVLPFQVVGGPDWLRNDRFDVVAKAESAEATPADMNVALQGLLAERFKLVVRRENREQPVYHLVKARSDGALGPGLKASPVECGRGGRGPMAGPPPAGGAAGSRGGVPAGPSPNCRMMMAPGRFTVTGQPLSALANALSNVLARPVYDRTELAGGYDFELSFRPEGGGGMPAGPPPPGAPELPPIDPNAPSVFTALSEQLGLRLESTRGPVDVIVVESIAPPAED